MRTRPWLVDLAIGVLVAIIALIVSPGFAITAIIALVVLLIVTVSLLIGMGRRRRRGRAKPGGGR